MIVLDQIREWLAPNGLCHYSQGSPLKEGVKTFLGLTPSLPIAVKNTIRDEGSTVHCLGKDGCAKSDEFSEITPPPGTFLKFIGFGSTTPP